MYGLLEDAGSKEARKVKLTKHALDYFRDERPEHREQKLKDFATNPRLFSVLFNKYWGASVPDDTVARSLLKVDAELNDQSARSALSIYRENMTFAKLKGGGNITETPEDSNEPSDVKLGDYIQWTANGQDQFKPPRRVNWVAEDGSHVRVHGSLTGIPVTEVTVVDPPKPALGAVTAASAYRADNDQSQADFSVLQVGKRLQITADVDAAGLANLQQVLDKYAEILNLVSGMPDPMPDYLKNRPRRHVAGKLTDLGDDAE
jgi:hypothetical protein